ncbi:lytic murein transglycosylase [Novosphingobium flavum]|uniref:Lytic murein transglycosylase n=1 Tax=Novosphingobium flavum TaxID=1778672 RepID=A0A7X1FT96_9SPHN|nr:lytic murein transglycosylase [Novosphingobium flavum]MBC2666459.1 lytic murein transglycosylase [Novosphingobium flavum]
MTPTFRHLRQIGLGFALVLLGVPCQAQNPPAYSPSEEAGFEGYLQLLAARARSEGVRETTIQQMTAGLTFNPKVIALDRSQPGAANGPAAGSPAFAPYRRTHVDAARIAAGRAMYANVRSIAPAVEARFGVPAPILLAIWGHETNYGRYTGDFDLARSLATLAYEGRRRALFSDEFIALLKMADAGVPRSRLVGSWAGAFGNPQFLPSMYLRLAVDGDGDGFRDIWSSRADTLASIANYFRDAGWQPGLPWGVAASVPAGIDRASLASPMTAPECPRVHARHSRWLTVSEWRARGVQPLAPLGDKVLASLIEPDGPGQTAYLLTGNYRVILEYNCSNYYGLSVGLLADEIAR